MSIEKNRPNPLLRAKPAHDILEIDALGPEQVSAPGDRLDLRKKIAVSVTVQAEFHTQGDGDLVIHLISSPDDDSMAGIYDTVDYTQVVLACDPGEIAQKTIAVNGAVRFLKAYAVNEDVNYDITEIKVTAAPLGAEELRNEELVHFNWR